MQIARIIRSAALVGAAVFMMAADARADTITFNTAQTERGARDLTVPATWSCKVLRVPRRPSRSYPT